MSSIENPQAERLQRFFEDELLPRAEALRRRSMTFFPLGPDDPAGGDGATGGWQGPPTWPDLSTAEPSELARQLDELWQAQGLDELEGLAEKLGELALELEQGEDQSVDLSPYVYIMY